MRPGFFVTLEGGEGAGKSTQARRLAERLRGVGRDVVLTREPGGTPGAEALRELLLFGTAPLSWRAQALGHMAARAEHLDRLILPALNAGKVVVCDRFHDSTVVYQGYGVGRADPTILEFIEQLRATMSNEPDMTLLLDVPANIGRARIQARGGAIDRYEAEDMAFHIRITEGFRDLARRHPDRITPIDAGCAPEMVEDAIFDTVTRRMHAKTAI